MNLQEEWLNIIRRGAIENMSFVQFLTAEIREWLASPKRQMMQAGVDYYEGRMDIDRRERLSGSVLHVPNNRVQNNQYAKLVDQKVSYLLSKPWTVSTDVPAYADALKLIFNNRFRRLLRNIGEDSLTAGVGYMYLYYDAGELKFRRFRPTEILPFWADDEKTELEAFARVFGQEKYEGLNKRHIVRVEYYGKDGVKQYVYEGGILTPVGDVPYVTDGAQAWTPERLPLIVFRGNDREIPLIARVKSLQDALNALYSDCLNALQEDVRSTILVLQNYEGEDLAEFRQKLMQYGAIKVRTEDGVQGGVDTLHIEVNADNYVTVEKLLKRAIVENGRGLDAKDDRMGGNPNQMNIRSMYSDMDLDANAMEIEYQAAFEELLYFVNNDLKRRGKAVDETDVQILFNRDVLVNEGEVIDNCAKSVGVLSKQTIIENHPWIKDASQELERLAQEDELTDYVQGGGDVLAEKV